MRPWAASRSLSNPVVRLWLVQSLPFVLRVSTIWGHLDFQQRRARSDQIRWSVVDEQGGVM
jgi:hypothetical protein